MRFSQLFATVFHCCDDQIGLLDEAQGTQEDGVGLSVTEVLLQSGGEALGIFDKLSFTLLQSLFARAESDVTGHFVDSIQ